MIYKKGGILVLIIILLSYNCYSLGDAGSSTTEDIGKTIEILPEEPITQDTLTDTGFTYEENPSEANRDEIIKTIDTTTSDGESIELQGTIPEDYSWATPQGSITSFSMTNALFSLGSLIQGSFISFSNNNNIYLKSLFDNSQFTATVNKDGQLEVGQINGHGETGKVYIEISNGNLTQDDKLTFIPTGENPTYIYYNTTEIEFKDGNLSYKGELITNSIESSRVEFDDNEFTKVQLQPKEIYQNFNYKIINLENEDVYICKNNPLCDINIEGSRFTINGKANLTYKDETIYTSYDENNLFTIDVERGESSLSNSRPNKDILISLCTGSHYLEQTNNILYDTILDKKCPILINSYTYNGRVVNIQLDTLTIYKYQVYSNYQFLLEKIKELKKLL